MGLPVAAALTHFKVQTKRVHAERTGAMHKKSTPWHAICSGMLKLRS
jgi:hypothetical protein